MISSCTERAAYHSHQQGTNLLVRKLSREVQKRLGAMLLSRRVPRRSFQDKGCR